VLKITFGRERKRLGHFPSNKAANNSSSDIKTCCCDGSNILPSPRQAAQSISSEGRSAGYLEPEEETAAAGNFASPDSSTLLFFVELLSSFYKFIYF